MESISGKGIMRGRPFGGIGVLVNRRLARKVICLATAERHLIFLVFNIIVINVYLPVCKEQDVYINCMADIFLGINYILDQYPNYSVIIADDFNCDIIGNSIGCELVRQFMFDHKLTC